MVARDKRLFSGAHHAGQVNVAELLSDSAGRDRYMFLGREHARRFSARQTFGLHQPGDHAPLVVCGLFVEGHVRCLENLGNVNRMALHEALKRLGACDESILAMLIERHHR